MSKTILHLCADIGSDSKPYKDAGYNVLCVGKNLGVENFNVQNPDSIYGVIANPVCTEFSIARNHTIPRDFNKGMYLVNHCLRIIGQCKNLKFWMIENPATGFLKQFLGTPSHQYEPWWYGDPWTKKTALWGKFNIPQRIYYRWEDVPKNINLYIRPKRQKPSMACLHKSAIKFIPSFQEFTVENDMSFRSLCPQGFAKAFFETNN